MNAFVLVLLSDFLSERENAIFAASVRVANTAARKAVSRAIRLIAVILSEVEQPPPPFILDEEVFASGAFGEARDDSTPEPDEPIDLVSDPESIASSPIDEWEQAFAHPTD